MLKLELPAALRGFLVTTNAIENLIGSARRTSRNVTRWRSGDMILRWTAVGLLHAEQSFRRIRGYRVWPKNTVPEGGKGAADEEKSKR